MPLAHALMSSTDTGSASGTVVVAEEQRSGRGRHQRRWETPFGTALLTGFLLCPPYLPANMAQLPMVAGLSTIHAIAETVPALRSRLVLKWPNDVLIRDVPSQDVPSQDAPSQDAPSKDTLSRNDPVRQGTVGFRKVSGILADAAFENNQPTHAVLGIGINVNQCAEQLPTVAAGALPPTSLLAALGQAVDRTQLLIALCQQLGTYVNRLSPSRGGDNANPAHEAELVYNEWRTMLHTLGQPITVHSIDQDGDAVAGTALDVTADGSLVVVDDAGTHHTFAAGDVSLRGTL